MIAVDKPDANTTTMATGLKIKAALDTRAYGTAVDVTDEEFAATNLKPGRFYGDWKPCDWPTTTRHIGSPIDGRPLTWAVGLEPQGRCERRERP